MRRWAVLALALAASGVAADWLTEGGDPSRSNWQARETTLTPENVKGLKLLWKRALGEAALTAPVILGPIITHRGIKELVFVESAANDIYAVDADLGRSFWSRRLESAAAPCGGAPATPAITPENIPTREDGEGHTPMRPLYFAASDGLVHKVSPSTGEDMTAPRKGAAACGRGTVEMADFAPRGTSWFVSKGRKFTLGGEGAAVKAAGAIATWEDSAGTRWIYSATAEGLQAWTFNGSLMKAWKAPALGPPVIANGMLFALGSHELHVLEAKTGHPLFALQDVPGSNDSSPLALANGHICFTSGNVLYCFGLPLEI